MILIALLVIAGAVLYLQQREVASQEGAPQNEEPVSGGRAMSIEEYVRQNISELSPEPEVLGGTYYVTEIEAANGKGVVSYEDGHVAYTADFTYSIEPTNGAITINSFVVRE